MLLLLWYLFTFEILKFKLLVFYLHHIPGNITRSFLVKMSLRENDKFTLLKESEEYIYGYVEDEEHLQNILDAHSIGYVK